MTQSPELAGGEGFTFEGDVAAFYLAALLAEAYAPGIDDRIVVGVSLQQRDFGEPLDDVIVDFEDMSKRPARLSLQVKRSLTISKANTNTDFRDVIRDSWATLHKSDFRKHNDRYGAAVGTITPTKQRALNTLCDWARESVVTAHFSARFEQGGSASSSIKDVKNDVVTLLEESKGAPCTSEEIHQFLAHFVLIQFDFLREGATDPPDAINRIRECLSADDAAKAPLVWARVVQLARSSAGKSGQFDRKRLVHSISSVARFRGSTSLRPDLEKLTELARSYSSLIPDDVGGARLDRASLLDEITSKLTSSRFVQIRGLPGSGKSVMVKRAVQRALECGPAIFLKAEQLEGTSWISFATSQGLSNISLQQLLVEVGAAGTPILFIDAIDRIEKEHQPIIIDLIRTIAESPLLDNWSVIASLRDTGIEVLHNWLGDFLGALKLETLEVGQLDDEEAKTLAKANPHLRPILFGSTQVKEVVRRPFFAKVLAQSYIADSDTSTFAPKSEIDLIENWWQRGGYNEAGQSAIERQQTLLDLAGVHARHLSQPIGLSQLKSVAYIDDLRSDGILQNARQGISVRFAHDIFFEWAYYYVLAGRGAQWTDEIKDCGEPPAIARVVELTSQWEYTQGECWAHFLAQTEDKALRSQWQRAWLTGPLGTARFEMDEDQFAETVFANDFHLFRKALVWFQAEKTSPNESILTGPLPQDQRQRLADMLGWPADFSAWRRFINFILHRVSSIPQRLYPEIADIFEVWQNALADISNPISRALLQQCAIWLTSIDAIDKADGPDENYKYWREVPDLGTFRKSLEQLLLRSSRAEPNFAADYLQLVINSERIHKDAFRDIIPYSPILAQSLPSELVELSLTYLRKELPDQQAAREEQERQRSFEYRKAIRDIPEAKRTPKQQMALSSGLFHAMGIRDFNRHDWDRLAINDDYQSFSPPSPLREPFHSLFQSSPEKALLLLSELCNHAIHAWRQLHRYSRDRDRTPVPLKLTFPWGTQQFWGTDREYLWFRSTWAPPAIGCGFTALEEWCFAELERKRTVDELIQKIVSGNECIAILGIAAVVALHTETVSEATLPLFTSQRLLAADHNRMVQDFSSTANLIGFTKPSDSQHIEAIKAANSRAIRKTQLSWMVPRFVLERGLIGDHSRKMLLNFKNELPYQYEEHRDIPAAQGHLTAQALKYAELADLSNYQAYRTEDHSEQIAVVHVSPSAAEPENVSKAEEASRQLEVSNLWTWASKSLEDESLSDIYAVEDAITLAKETDTSDLFGHLTNENEREQLGIRRGAIAATAAVVLSFREECSHEDLFWAREVLERAILLPEKPGSMWSPSSVIPWHHTIYVAQGLAADLRNNTSKEGAARDLLSLIAHPLEIVSLAALDEASKLWSNNPKLTWAAFILAFSLCHIPPRQDVQYGETLDSSRENSAALESAIAFYESQAEWAPIPLPPPAWVRVEAGESQDKHRTYEDYDTYDAADVTEAWREPDVYWHSAQAAEILQRIPFNEILNSNVRNALLEFLSGVLEWTNQKNAPPWVKPGRRDRSATETFEWTHALGSRLGLVAGLLPLGAFQASFLDPILALEGDNCWTLLSPFTNTYVCAYVYDAPVVPADAVATLDLCLRRLLQDSTFKQDSYRSGEFFGFDMPELVRTLMFVSVERADLAARYVNGDWSEIELILPLIDRFIRAGGWAATVMNPFLTLCERARAAYPANTFADQMLAIIHDEFDNLKGWHGTSIPARIAGLVQHFTHRDSPMSQATAQKFLRILDKLVDMGDRRSAALQLSEAFREIRLPS